MSNHIHMVLAFGGVMSQLLMRAFSYHKSGDVHEAEKQYRAILALEPQNYEASIALSMLLQQLQRREEAGIVLRDMRERVGDKPSLMLAMGEYWEDHDDAQAVQFYHKAIPLDTAYERLAYHCFVSGDQEQGSGYLQFLNHNSRFQLGIRLVLLSDKAATMACFMGLQPDKLSIEQSLQCIQFFSENEKIEKAHRFIDSLIQRTPDEPLLQMLKAELFEREGDIPSALATYEAITVHFPQYAEAYNRLAFLAGQLEHYEIAMEFFRRSLAIDAQQPEILHRLGVNYAAHQRLEEAEECWRRALVLEPTKERTLIKLVSLLLDSDIRDESEGISLMHRLLEKNPESWEGHQLIGHIYIVQGHRQKALEHYRKAYIHNRQNTKAILFLAQYAPEAPVNDVEVWIDLLRHGELYDDERVPLAFAIATVFDRTQEYAKAMPFYLEANALHRKHYVFSIEQTAQHFRTWRGHFGFVTPPSQVSEPGPIFIVGMMRSGSTLLAQMLTAHPKIGGGGEYSILPTVIGEALKNYPLPWTTEQYQEVGQEYMSQLRKIEPNSICIVDKLLPNFIHVGLIRQALPNARIIHTSRDTMDCCWSIFRHYFAGEHPYAYNLKELGQYHTLYREMMAYWDQIFPGFIYHLQHETLVATPKEELKALCSFLGIAFDPAMLEFSDNHRSVFTPSMIQVRGSLSTSAFGRHKAYLQWLKPLEEGLSTPLIASDIDSLLYS